MHKKAHWPARYRSITDGEEIGRPFGPPLRDLDLEITRKREGDSNPRLLTNWARFRHMAGQKN